LPAVVAKRRGRPVGPTSDDSRDLILATAVRLFGASGYAGVSMERLADESGRTVRAVYHYFPSKRALFQAATGQAFERFGREVLAKVFVHERLDDRVKGYLEVYRSLHRTDPHLVPFIGMVLVDAISTDAASARVTDGTDGSGLADAAATLSSFLERLVDDAMANGEVHPDVDREGAITLLAMLGRGLSLSALSDAASFAAMLDAFERLVDGTLLTTGLRRPAAGK
jgi:AcrR family transcriptional regulator